MSDHLFYAPIHPKEIKKQREAARALRKTNWWLSLVATGECYYCQNKFAKDELTMDHKVPIARGGKSTKNNIVVACKACNSEKQSMTASEFEEQKLGSGNEEF